MLISKVFPSKYAKFSDLGDQDRTVRIRDCIQEDLGQGNEKERKPVVYFEGHIKGVVLNKTNAGVISKAYGDDTETWKGRDIVLFVDPNVTFQGKTTPAIRVRIPKAAPQPVMTPAPQPVPATNPADFDEEIPLDDSIPW